MHCCSITAKALCKRIYAGETKPFIFKCAWKTRLTTLIRKEMKTNIESSMQLWVQETRRCVPPLNSAPRFCRLSTGSERFAPGWPSSPNQQLVLFFLLVSSTPAVNSAHCRGFGSSAKAWKLSACKCSNHIFRFWTPSQNKKIYKCLRRTTQRDILNNILLPFLVLNVLLCLFTPRWRRAGLKKCIFRRSPCDIERHN